VNIFKFILFFTAFCISTTKLISKEKNTPPVYLYKDGLVYICDEKGDRIPDYSFAGFMAGEKEIPNIPIKMVIPSQKEEATLLIQSAINYVSKLKPDNNGFRGAILLEKGTYHISGSLHFSVSGVVLRGSGMSNDGTILIAKGKHRETLIQIKGKNNRESGKLIKIEEEYVPVNTMKFKLPRDCNLKSGDKIIIQRHTNQKWINELGMDYYGGETDWLKWKPGERDVFWDRTIIKVENDSIYIDAPITCSIDTNWGGGSIIPYEWTGRISNIGIENLKCISEYDTTNQKDENHRWMAITVDNAQDVWVRQVTFEHFAGSAVMVNASSKKITVQDCKSLNPVSEIGGFRRYAFYTEGQQTLFQRCYSEYAYHDFAIGFCAAGPNAFVQCESYLSHGFSGAIDSWSCGTLFDIVRINGNKLCFSNRESDYSGAGWCAANSMFWQCSAAKIECYKPPYSQNWAFGTWGQFSGKGYWHECNSFVKPRSLYYAQLKDRIGDQVEKRAYLYPILPNALGNPTIEEAAKLAIDAKYPPTTINSWIDKVTELDKIPIQYPKNIITTEDIQIQISEKAIDTNYLKIENGWITYKNSIVTGKKLKVQWWRGDPRTYELPKTKPHITRFVPGKYGTGLTDDLNEARDIMVQNNAKVLEHNYGLWYDRRRDDHERVRRIDGEVWAPFYELPFSRSGKGIAWDGLSKYDLTSYNYWYWKRLNTFADLADKKGIVMLHHNYFQHNILEAGAHYADFPWRTANNINNTPFPEPVPYANDKRIYIAEQFYDISNPEYKKLHTQYIRKCLDNFKDNTNVVQLISAEYTGPLHFVEFWIDVIMEWEKETGKNATVGLSTTKDVQDAILSDPIRSKVIDLIDIRYWSYRSDGTLYAQPSGNLAPRQYARIVKSGKRSFDQIYRSVQEYKEKYPDKVIIYSEKNNHNFPWAVFMAGGSLAGIPEIEEPEFLISAARMKPRVIYGISSKQWTLSDEERNFIIYTTAKNNIQIDFNNFNGLTKLTWINPKNGKTIIQDEVNINEKPNLKNSYDHPVILWIRKNHK